MNRDPPTALVNTDTFRVIFVGLLKVTLLTTTSAVEAVAEMCFGKPNPGSKKPEPLTTCPVTTTFTLDTPAPMEEGLQFKGVAGKGARNCAACTAKPLFVNEHHSWMVHMVMS